MKIRLDQRRPELQSWATIWPQRQGAGGKVPYLTPYLTPWFIPWAK